MKITLPITALAAILGLALAGIPVHAQTTATAPAAAPTATPTKAASAKKTPYSGTLSAVDASSITITDKTAAAKTLAIAPTTKFLKDGKTATIADFAVGDKVTGSFTTDATGKLTAASLHKGASAKKAKKDAAAATTAPATPAAQ